MLILCGDEALAGTSPCVLLLWQMVAELKDQNNLLKNEKDDLNRLIQEQSQQMTGMCQLNSPS